MKNLTSSWERLARIYSNQSGIKLFISGSSFLTNGKKIVIADIPEKLNKELGNPALAGLLHECLHVQHSEKLLVENLKNDKFFNKFQGLINNIEDIRMLYLGKKQYAGMKGLQTAGLSFIKMALTEAIEQKTVDLPTLLGAAIHYESSDMDLSFFPPTVCDMASQVKDIYENYKWLPEEDGHKQGREVTEKIVEKLKDYLKEEKKKKGRKDKKNNKQTKNKDENENDKSGNKRDKNENKEGKKGKKKGKDEDNKTEDNKEHKDSPNGNNAKDNSSDDKNNRIENENNKKEESLNGEVKKELENLEKEIEETEGQQAFNGEDLEEDLENFLTDQEDEPDPLQINNATIDDFFKDGLLKQIQKEITKIIDNETPTKDKHIPIPEAFSFDIEETIKEFHEKQDQFQKDTLDIEFKKLQQEIDSQTQKLKAKVLPLLLAEKRSSFLFEQKEGMIDDSKLYKIFQSNSKIYKQKVSGRKKNTAITILCDISGSMSESKINMVKKTLLVLGDSLFALKIPFELLCFSTQQCPYKLAQIIENKYKDFQAPTFPYNRLALLHHVIIKSFNENYLNNRKLIASLHSCQTNCDCESVMWAAKRLSLQKEDRKILFVLSDGWPNLEDGIYGQRVLVEKALKENVIEVEKSGIEVIGIGILTSAPRGYYKSCKVINKIDDIAKEVYSSLYERLKSH